VFNLAPILSPSTPQRRADSGANVVDTKRWRLSFRNAIHRHTDWQPQIAGKRSARLTTDGTSFLHLALSKPLRTTIAGHLFAPAALSNREIRGQASSLWQPFGRRTKKVVPASGVDESGRCLEVTFRQQFATGSAQAVPGALW